MTDPSGIDPSSQTPMESPDDGWKLAKDPNRRCTAHHSDGSGKRCEKVAIRGGNVCPSHGGRAKKTVEKARLRLAENADRGAKQLLRLAFDEKQSAEIRLKATLQLLDRAGVNAKTSVEVEHSMKPFEVVLSEVSEVVTGSREDFRRARDGLPPIPPALAGRSAQSHSDEIVDAVIVDEGEEVIRRMRRYSDVNDPDGPMTYDHAEHPRDERTTAHTPPPGGSTGGMSLEEANEEVARLRRNAPPMRPPLGLRALPRGRSGR